MHYVIYSDQEVAEIFSTIPDEVKKVMKGKYVVHSHNASERLLKMKMSFEQWAAIWWDSGKWELRGCSKSKPYQMCRKDDLGDYEMGNVRLDTIQSNREDAREKYTAIWQDPESRERKVAAVKLRLSKPIQGSNEFTGEVRVWNSLSDAARELNYSFGSISKAANGKIKSAGGYTWKYL